MTISEDGLNKNQANFAALSPLSFLERTSKTFPNLIALEYQDYKLNYEQALIRCNALANFIIFSKIPAYRHVTQRPFS